MSNVSTAIQSSVIRASAGERHLPWAVLGLFRGVHGVHRLWRWYRKAELYSNPDHFVKLASGGGISLLLGENNIFRVAAQSLLIAKRVLDAIKQTEKVYESAKRIKDIWQGKYVYISKVSWEKKKGCSLFSSSTKNFIKEALSGCIVKIKMLAAAIFNCLMQVFKLSMRVMDAIDACYISPVTKNESIGEVFVNASALLDEIVINKEEMLGGLKTYEKTIDSFLTGIDSPLRAAYMTSALGKILSVAETVQSLSGFGGKVAKDFAHRTAFEMTTFAGLDALVPDALKPGKEMPWENKKDGVEIARFQ